jgi:hypothetical protein
VNESKDFPHIFLEGLKNITKCLNIPSVVTEIITENLLDARLGRYHYINLLGVGCKEI